MPAMQSLVNPAFYYRKVKQYGFGRSVAYALKPFPRLYWATRTPIRLLKIAVDLPGFIRRKRLAAQITKGSRLTNIFPEDKAFCVVPPGTFPAVEKIMPIARRMYDEFQAQSVDLKRGNSSYSYLLDTATTSGTSDRVADLKAYPDFLDFACNRDFVEMATHYLGEVPILGNVDLQVVAPNEHTEGFQQFHIDRNASRQFRVFVPVEDVDEGNGATMLIPADVSAQIERALGHKSGRIPDSVLQKEPWARHLTHSSAPAGSTIIFDACRAIHCGGRARTRPRVLIMLLYVSKYGYAELQLEKGNIQFDKAQVAGDTIRELLFNMK